MKLHKIAVGIAVLSILGGDAIAANVLPLNPKIDTFVQKQFKSKTLGADTTILVILREQADLSGADIVPVAHKGRFVYDKLRTTALETQKSLVEFLKSNKVNFRQFYIENMISVDNPSAELVQKLVDRDDVVRIMGNPTVRLKMPANVPTLGDDIQNGPEGGLLRVSATRVWDSFNDRGEGVVVASQDTGVQWDHPAIVKQYRGASEEGVDHNYNWHDSIHHRIAMDLPASSCGYDTQVPCDDSGHGTHTVGTMVGDDGKGNQIGVAPKAKWVGCRNMDNGVGTAASYIECFEYFLAPYPLQGNNLTDGEPSRAPHIINNSWGCTRSEGCVGDEILPALTAMKKAGIFVVASAGNEGPSCGSIDAPPAWHSGLTLSVAAFNHRNDQIASFSSRGPSTFDDGIGPNISAPGVVIRSSIPGGGYASFSGTSMAGPHAVGVAALLWSFNKNLIGDIDKSIMILERTAEPKTTPENCGGKSGLEIPNYTYGYGFINAYNAVCSQSMSCA